MPPLSSSSLRAFLASGPGLQLPEAPRGSGWPRVGLATAPEGPAGPQDGHTPVRGLPTAPSPHPEPSWNPGNEGGLGQEPPRDPIALLPLAVGLPAPIQALPQGRETQGQGQWGSGGRDLPALHAPAASRPPASGWPWPPAILGPATWIPAVHSSPRPSDIIISAGSDVKELDPREVAAQTGEKEKSLQNVGWLFHGYIPGNQIRRRKQHL